MPSGQTMGRIERLPDDLVNKIAAGEVVERPASVVKELLENALDAEARSILVEIEGGGKGLIRVRDDGHGMSREDAALALERHATSKLRSLADLASLETHGFRGEALPSIASVSHLRLRTRERDSEAGTEVEVRHGRAAPAKDAGHPVGTTVEVRDLFGATPARRKFLRADSTEASHVSEAVTLLALARPGTGFTLLSGGRAVLEAPPTEDLEARVYQIFGGAFLDELVPVLGEEGVIRVTGYVGRPAGRESGGALRLFVNGRAVRDRALAKAVSEAYRAAGTDRAEAILFVRLPPHLLDVNVHPAKTEVRFADPRAVFAAVEGHVERALSAGARAAPRADTTRIGSPGMVYDGPERGSEVARELLKPIESLLPELAPHPLGQHRLTYIVSTDGEDLVLVDQHTAHERVRFEALVGRLEARSAESQRLLVPQIVALPPRLRPLLEAYRGDLEAVGFDVEPFGGDSLRIGAVPALLGTRDPGPALESLLRDLLERETTSWVVSGSRDRLAATLACHSAVRAGQALTLDAMGGILRDLAATSHPTICPHGRPTSVRIPREEIARWFERTGWRRS
jgi:DNA mismatch repair protein MutL